MRVYAWLIRWGRDSCVIVDEARAKQYAAEHHGTWHALVLEEDANDTVLAMRRTIAIMSAALQRLRNRLFGAKHDRKTDRAAAP